jgi:hypothetical protein
MNVFLNATKYEEQRPKPLLFRFATTIDLAVRADLLIAECR